MGRQGMVQVTWWPCGSAECSDARELLGDRIWCGNEILYRVRRSGEQLRSAFGGVAFPMTAQWAPVREGRAVVEISDWGSVERKQAWPMTARWRRVTLEEEDSDGRA